MKKIEKGKTFWAKLGRFLSGFPPERCEEERLTESVLARLATGALKFYVSRRDIRHLEEGGVVRPYHPIVKSRLTKEAKKEEQATLFDAKAREDLDNNIRALGADFDTFKGEVSRDISKTDEQVGRLLQKLDQLECRVDNLSTRIEAGK